VLNLDAEMDFSPESRSMNLSWAPSQLQCFGRPENGPILEDKAWCVPSSSRKRCMESAEFCL